MRRVVTGLAAKVIEPVFTGAADGREGPCGHQGLARIGRHDGLRRLQLRLRRRLEHLVRSWLVAREATRVNADEFLLASEARLEPFNPAAHHGPAAQEEQAPDSVDLSAPSQFDGLERGKNMGILIEG